MLSTIILKNIRVPTYVRSDHQRLRLTSTDLSKFIEQELSTLKTFHNFCQKNSIHYSLIAWTLMGYYVIGEAFPWDDDIDVVMSEQDYKKFLRIFISLPEPGHTRFHRAWICKKIEIDWEQFWLCRHKYNIDWMKLVKYPWIGDIGGIDFGFTWEKEGKTYESMNKNKIAPVIQENNLCRVFFGGIETMVVNKSIAENYLNTVYGNNWKELVHPDYHLGIIRQYIRYLNQSCRYTLRHSLLQKFWEKIYTWSLRNWYFDYKKEQIAYFFKQNRLIKSFIK